MHLWLDVSDSLQMLGGPSATVQVEWVTSGVEPGGYLPCSQQAAAASPARWDDAQDQGQEDSAVLDPSLLRVAL